MIHLRPARSRTSGAGPFRVRVRVLTAAVLAVPAVAVALSSAPAAADIPVSGTFVAEASTPLFDTRSGLNAPQAALGPDASLTVPVPAGIAPAQAILALHVVVASSTASGWISAFPAGPTPATQVSVVNYTRGLQQSNLALVATSAGSSITIVNHSSGSVELGADVSGYYAPGATPSSSPGALVSHAATALFDTRSGLGVPRRAIGANAAVSFPTTYPQGTVLALHLVVASSTGNGWLGAYPYGGSSGVSVVNYTAGQQQSNLAMVQVGPSGRVVVANHSAGTVQVAGDSAAYFVAGSTLAANQYVSLPATPVLDTRSGLGGVPRTAIAPGGSVTTTVAGHRAIPAGAVVALHVVVASSTGSGWLAAYPTGAPVNVSVLNYARGQQQSNLALTALSGNGRVTITNHSTGSVQIAVDVAGYHRTEPLSVPNTSISRYVTSLSTIADEGGADAGSTLILLHVGTQSVTEPQLSPTNPGVALSRTNPVTRATYASVVSALQSYLANLGTARSGNAPAATVVVDTTTDGSFKDQDAIAPYEAAARGQDWWTSVIKPLQAAAPSGVSVVAGLDAEASFGGSYTDASTWESSYLTAAAGASGANSHLVFTGTLDNCPDQVDSTLDCGPVARSDDSLNPQTWTFAQYVTLAHGLNPSRISVLPQIYYHDAPGLADQPVQWANLERHASGTLTFTGVLSENGVDSTTLTPADAWAALYYALLNDYPNVVLPGGTDLQPH